MAVSVSPGSVGGARGFSAAAGRFPVACATAPAATSGAAEETMRRTLLAAALAACFVSATIGRAAAQV
jgi:hypothetical protein